MINLSIPEDENSVHSPIQEVSEHEESLSKSESNQENFRNSGFHSSDMKNMSNSQIENNSRNYEIQVDSLPAEEDVNHSYSHRNIQHNTPKQSIKVFHQ